MTAEAPDPQDRDRSLHRAMESSLRRLPPSTPPLAQVLRAGRARQRRRRATAGVAVGVTAACIALPLLFKGAEPNSTDGVTPAQPQSSARVSQHPSSTPTAATSQAAVGSGVLSGTAWSVKLQIVPPTAKQGLLLCPRMTIGGVRVDAAGGPFADCQGADSNGKFGRNNGVYQVDGGGLRLFVSVGTDDVASAVVTFSDGRTARATSVTVPHSAANALAVAIAPGERVTSIDEYDTHGVRVSQQTDMP